jgi:pimeloyl-ACP methyl ester carboxylesterase
MRPAGAFPSEAILREERDMSLKDASVVLVHGAWADGSSWRKVIGLLKAQGIRVFAAPLPLTSLADDTAALERTLERIDGAVVLAGHAYAGAVIAATRSEKVKALAYIAALAPDSIAPSRTRRPRRWRPTATA